MTCPDCDGRGSGIACVDCADRSKSGVREIPCPRCAGTGQLTAEQMAAYEAGRKLRNDRVARGVSLREEARRLGITATELSDRENGRG